MTRKESILLIILFVLLGEITSAEVKVVVNCGVQVGNLNYDICESKDSASVAGTLYKEKYRGDITIPSTIIYKGHTYNVLSINASAFENCKELKSVHIPNSVKHIGRCAFKGCESLVSVNFPTGVTKIEWRTFYECNSLTSIIIPRNIKEIKGEAFADCSALESVSMPYGIQKLAYRTFYHCKKLKKIFIPNSVTEIETHAFAGCESLLEISIPYSVINMGKEIFVSCTSLKAPIYNAHCFAYLPPSHKGAFVVPDGIKLIAGGAFAGCSFLNSVTIPNSVEDMGEGVFYGCTALKAPIYNAHCFAYLPPSYKGAFVVPDGIKLIAGGAFAGCSFLNSVTIPNSVEDIGNRAFSSCTSLSFIEIPNSVMKIGYSAFGGCTKLATVILPNKLTELGDFAFHDCTALKSTTIPSSLTKIGDFAFLQCLNLSEVTIQNGIVEIGNWAFKECTNLKSIFIPSSVKKIDEDAFASCNSMQEFSYPRGLDLSKAQIPLSVKLTEYNPDTPRFISPPPVLMIVDESLSFTDISHNNCIDANEQSSIKFDIRNIGKGVAKNCEARVELSGTTAGISAKTIKLPTINVGEFCHVSIPVSSDANTQDGQVTFSIEVYEPNGWGMEPFDLNVTTKAFEAPLLQVTKFKISTPSGKVHRMEYATLLFDVQNIKYGNAENVHVRVILPDNIAVIDGESDLSFPKIKPGEIKSSQLDFVVNKNYVESTIPIIVDIKEKYGKYAESKNIEVELATTASSVANITAKEEKSTYKIVTVKDNALIIPEKPSINILQNTSVSILRPEWFNRYDNPQNIKSPFPYAAIKLEIKGDKGAIDVAKERLSLMMGGKHIVEAKDTKETNTIWFLVHCRNEYIDLDCGDGCEPINIWKERLEPNRVYYCRVRIVIQ